MGQRGTRGGVSGWSLWPAHPSGLPSQARLFPRPDTRGPPALADQQALRRQGPNTPNPTLGALGSVLLIPRRGERPAPNYGGVKFLQADWARGRTSREEESRCFCSEKKTQRDGVKGPRTRLGVRDGAAQGTSLLHTLPLLRGPQGLG